jgi:3-hydroxyacyl-[acyl-carrier-protein] dehydratase
MSGLDRASAVASPVTGDIELVRHEGDSAVTSVQISPQEQVFAGHYPSFPIFPGICIVECVLRSARLAPAAPGLRLAAVESTRFQDPVFPGDILMIELTWSRHGEAWRCRSEARTARGRSAQVRLRFDTLDAAC